MPCTKVNTLSQTGGLLSKAPKSSFSITLIRVNAAKFEYSDWIFLPWQRRELHEGWRAPVLVLCEALARWPGCVWELLSCTTQIVTRTVCLTGVVKETQRWLWTGGGEMKQAWGPVYHHHHPPPPQNHPPLRSPGRGSGSKSTPNQRC